MPDRVVTYSFRGNFANLGAGLTTMGRNVTELGTKLTALDKSGQRMRAGLTQLGTTGGTVGLALAAGVAVAVRAAANFEQAMSNVQAATHETADNMGLLRQAALDAGQATKFSATEAAGAIEELAKAGVSTKDILGGGLSGALDLAAAGGLEVADAASIAATALTQFRLQGADVPHVADLLAAAAGKAQGDVTDMSMALKQSGLVASQMGVSIEETTGTLAAFASAGLLGSDAGTSFRTMLLRLANPTTESAKLMKSLGIEAYNAQGQFVGIESLAGQLQTAFQGQTQAQRDAALATIFGSDAIRAATVLYTEGADGVSKWTDEVNDQGYAAETAAIKMDNLKGDLEQLGGALETAFIGAGGGAQGPLRELVQGITDTVNAFNDLPGPAQSAATAIGAVGALLGGGLFVGSRAVRGIADTRQALQDLGVDADKASKNVSRMSRAFGAAAGIGTFVVGLQNTNEALGTFEAAIGGAAAGFSVGGPWGAAVGGAIGLVTALGTSHDNTKAQVADLTATFDAQTGAITENTRVKIANQLQTDGLYDAAEQLGIANSTITDAVMGNAQAQAYLNDTLAGYDVDHTITSAEDLAASFSEQEIQAILANRAATVLRDGIPSLADNFSAAADDARQLASGAQESSAAAGEFAGSAGEAGDAAAQAATEVAEMTKAMEEQRQAAIGAFDAVTAYRQAMKDATKQAKDNNKGIQGNSDAALANRDALSRLAAAWNNQSQVVTDNVKKYREAKQNFIDTATAMGVPEKAARQLANQLLEIPTRINTQVTADTGQAESRARTLKQILDSLKSKDIYVALHYQTIGNKPKAPTPGDPNSTGADGGTVPKTGLPYADRHPYLLADGEEIISNRYGQADRFRADRAAGRIPQYADGGTTGKPSAGDPRNKARDFSFFTSPELAQLIDAAGGAAKAIKLLERQSARAEKALDKQNQALDKASERLETARGNRDAVRANMDALSGSVTGRLFDVDLGAEPTNPWAAGGGGGIEAMIARATNQAQAFPGIVQALTAAGFSGASLEEAFQEMSFDQLQALAGDPARAGRLSTSLNALYSARGTAGESLADARYGEEYAQRQAEFEAEQKAYDRAEAQRDKLRDEVRELRRETREVKQAINDHDTHNQNAQRDNAQFVTAGVNGAAGNGERNRVYRNGGRRGR